MPIPVLLAIALTQDQTQTNPVAQEATNLSKPYEILEPVRIAMTPRIDGKLEEEEWDEVGSAGAGKGYLEWEPNAIHAAVRVPEGRDLLLSIDFRSNGWLIGSDNFEVRITGADMPKMTARLLDATRVTGPMWIDLAGFGMTSKVAAKTEEGMTTYEVSLTDPGIGLLPVDDGASFSVRMDAPLSTEAPFEPFVPRVLSKVSLGMQRSAALPAGLKFNTEGAGNNVAPGGSTKLRLTFNGNNTMNLTRIAMRSEGLAKDGTTKIEVPFPKFDNKGRAFVDYSTMIADTVPIGYKVMRAEILGADGVKSMTQSSYRVAPMIDFDLVRQQLPAATNDRSARYSVYVRSNASSRLTGNISILVPAPLRVMNTSGWNLQMSAGQKSRYTFDLFVPQNAIGTYPVTFKGTLNGTPVEETVYITIGGM